MLWGLGQGFFVALVAQAFNMDDIMKAIGKVEEKVEDVKDEVSSLQLIRNAVWGQPAESVRTKETATEVREASTKHHKTNGCLILKGLFGSKTEKEYKYNSSVAHIFKKSMASPASALGINVADPRNTLILLRHFELEFDRGNLMFLPVSIGTGPVASSLPLQIFVHPKLREEEVWTLTIENKKTLWHEPVHVLDKTGEWQQLYFWRLHEKTFQASPVYMRSLFEKGIGAFNKHGNTMPNPHEHLKLFETRCSKWDEWFKGRFATEVRQVGTAPVIQDVEHSD